MAGLTTQRDERRTKSWWNSTTVFYYALFGGVFLIPFTAFYSIPGLGELERMPSYLFFIAAIAVFAAVNGPRIFLVPSSTAILEVLVIIFALVIIISYLSNIEQISTAEFKGVTGNSRFLKSVSVIFLMYLIFSVVRSLRIEVLLYLIRRVLLLSFVITIFMGYVEAVVNSVPQIQGYYEVLSSVFTAPGFNGWHFRVRSFAFEAPNLGVFITSALPWVLRFSTIGSGRSRPTRTSLLLFIAVVGLSPFIASRTLYVALTIYAILMVSFVLIRRSTISNFATAVYVCGAVATTSLIFVVDDQAITELTTLESTTTDPSNLSRTSMIYAARELFETSPMVGIGSGQFQMQVASVVPATSLISWEVGRWFDLKFETKPSVYSLQYRILCELGLLGICVWIAWCTMFVAMSCRLMRSGHAPMAEIGLSGLMGGFGCLIILYTFDTFAVALLWIGWGITEAFYRYEVRGERVRSTTAR